MRPSSRIKVTKPDPETGELIEMSVPASRYKAKKPTWPKLDRDRLTTPSRAVLYMFAHREREIAYWEAYAETLTPQERRDIASERTSAVLRPIEPKWEPGTMLEVSSKLTVGVRGTKWTHRGYRTSLWVQDFRPYYLRRVPATQKPPDTDKHGNPILPSKEAIEAARIDGNYTTSAELAITDAGEAMDDRLHRRIHGEIAVANAGKAAQARKKKATMDLEMRLAEARSKNWRSTVRYLERVKKHHERKRAA